MTFSLKFPIKMTPRNINKGKALKNKITSLQMKLHPFS